MKNFMVLSAVFVALASLGMAQSFTQGSSPISGTDILGAHNNYGRGCAACHAPHSGAFGAGGNGQGVTAAIDAFTGSNAIFAQNMKGLFGKTFNFGDSANYAWTADAGLDVPGYTIQQESVRGILMCLACHDGVDAKGGMMKGVLYEAILPQLSNTFTAKYGTAYANIPTLLGNDGSGIPGANAYSNDHPVGIAANFGKLGLGSYLTVTFNGTAIQTITPTAGVYTSFVANYGYPAIAGSAFGYGFANPDGNSTPGNLYVTCTSCHNQHSMYIYQAPVGKQTGAAIVAGGTYPTFFFINSPYNITILGATDDTTVASTTQFCRQCHFQQSNEVMGVTSVATQF